jgi:hypothetical protein
MDDVVCLIKKAALDAVEAEKPVDVMFGVVAGDRPVAVDVEQKLWLSGESLVVMKGVEVNVGDRVALLRVCGGQEFVLLGVVDEERGDFQW